MFKKTVDSVISDISKKISQLRDVAEEHHVLVGKHLEIASGAQVQANIHAGNRERATRIATKFEELLK